jgi:acetyl-CoA C-acetyltransferase
MTKEVVITSAARTAIGKFQGALSAFSAPQLGSLAIKEAVKRSGLNFEAIDEVIMGNVITAGLGQNPARQAALGAGVTNRIGALTVNKVCGSGLKAAILAAQAIKAEDANVLVTGGMESMTNAPYLLPQARAGQRLGHGKLIDAMVFDGLWDIYNDFHMGMTAELVAEKYKISRDDQDKFALASNQKAAKATKDGLFKEEIFPVEIPQSKGPAIIFAKDEGPREDAALDKLAKLKPAFKGDGTVTAGNSSQLSDGAAAMVVMSRDYADKLNIKPLCRITGYATGGMAPEWVMMAPLEAVKNLLAKTKMKVTDFDLWELNEAFAVQGVALTRELKLDPAKVNIHGGAVALGHPIGCSGARVLTTLIYALKQRHLKKGLAALCLGGGNAVAMSIEII